MSDSNAVIVAKVGGRQRRLATRKQWRAAIANKDIARDTEISYEPGVGRQATMRAGDCPDLVDLFDELVGPVAVPAPAPAPAPAVVSTPLPPPLVPTPQIWAPAPPEPDPVFETPPPPPPAPPPASQASQSPDPRYSRDAAPSSYSGEGAKPFVIVALLIAAGIAAAVLFSGGGSDEYSEDMPAEAAEVAAEAGDAAVVQGERYFAARSVSVHSQPNDGSAVIRSLGRGEEVYGTNADASGWIMLTGQLRGFVRTGALNAEAPPSIDASTAKDYFSIEPTQIYARPDATTSEVLGTLPIHTKISVAGTVNGSFAEFLYEGDRVGYVSWDALGGPGGNGRYALLQLSNKCSTYKNVALSLVIDGVRSNGMGFWTLAPGSFDAISYGDKPGKIYVNSTELYYYDVGDNDTGEFIRVEGKGIDQVYVNGKLREMKRMIPRATSDGSYVVSFCE